jgi:hypothetical protein
MLLLPAEIDLDDTLVTLHLVKRSITEDMALMKNGDFAPELPNENHVMFNDDDRVLACQA